MPSSFSSFPLDAIKFSSLYLTKMDWPWKHPFCFYHLPCVFSSSGRGVSPPRLSKPLAGAQHPILSPAGVELSTLGMGLLRWSDLLARCPPYFFIWERLSCCQYYRFSISSLIMAPWLGKWLVGLPDMKTLVSISCLSGHIACAIRQPFEQLHKMLLPSPPSTSHWGRLSFNLHADSSAKPVRRRNHHSASIYVLISLFSQTAL